MANVTLEQINNNILELNKEVEIMKERIEEITDYIKEDYELADDVKKQIENSRKRHDSEFISHAEVKKRFS